MARYNGPKCRLCRREGMKLFLKGTRCESDKCALNRRDYPPGQITARRSKASAYGEQLREKQKVKRFYGVTEATRSKGNTGESLMLIFERRLDNVVYRLGWAASRGEARQLITHGHINVGDRRVSVPSYNLELNEEISVRKGERSQKFVRKRAEESKGKQLPPWLSFDLEGLKGKVVALPTREDVSIPVSEQLIVELLSK
jgi:small subunit ribosomal protein S4